LKVISSGAVSSSVVEFFRLECIPDPRAGVSLSSGRTGDVGAEWMTVVDWMANVGKRGTLELGGVVDTCGRELDTAIVDWKREDGKRVPPTYDGVAVSGCELAAIVDWMTEEG